MSQQQTILRVQTTIPHLTISGETQYVNLDLYSDIPIKINKSFAELQDISKKNTDFSVNLSLPGSKKNNRFFESFFNVDVDALYFFSNKKTACNVLIDSQSFFNGYMRLNKVNVLDSKVEYDVTLFSSVANLFGDIGNNLLKDLDFNDTTYTFNHTFTLLNTVEPYQDEATNFGLNKEAPYLYFYPLVHNGYEYSGSTINLTGGTTNEQTRFYTSTGPISAWTSSGDMYLAGVQHYRINTPAEGIYDNQLKPALSMWGLLKLIFKTYGYSITSDFMNTPWMKTLYMYGYFSSSATKFSYNLDTIEYLPREGVELIYSGSTSYATPLSIIICKRGTGIPCYCSETINYGFANMFPYSEYGSIATGLSGVTINAVYGFDFGFPVDGVPVADISTLRYLPKAVGTPIIFQENDPVNFSLVIDQNIKQIDILSSIAKKFNLVFIPDPNNPYNIIIEPYSYYIGTGKVVDWTDKLSYDKGFSVEPALNYIESNLIFTDQEDGDYGNKEFKDRQKQVYGTQLFYGPTDFKSETGITETIFSPEVLRQWDTPDQPNNGGIKLPLGINYVGSSTTESVGGNSQTYYAYRGLKTKPKLFWFLGCHNMFLDTLGEVYRYNTGYSTYNINVNNSSNSTGLSLLTAPIISHTMPMGMKDSNKINNDSACILFNSQFPIDIGVQTYNVYTENDAYNLFYDNRISNLYDSNTRFVSGFFDLKYSDIINLEPKDIIKIQEQFFYVNKIQEYNLVNRELTRVELVQTNLNPQTYPTRYFKYQYCDYASTGGCIFKIATDFTNPNLRDTSFGWSIFYDQMMGTLPAVTTGFTSCLVDTRTGVGSYYNPFTISEITESEYNNSGYLDWTTDTMLAHVWNYVNPVFPNTVYAFGLGLPSFWINSGGTYTGLNLFTNCTEFNSTATTYGILTGRSDYYGACNTTPTPTPTNTPTKTVTPTPTPTPTRAPVGQCYCFPIVVTGTTIPGPEGGTIATLQYNDCFGVLTARAFSVGPGTYYQCIQTISSVVQYDPIGTTGIDQSYLTLTYLTGNCNTGYDCSGYVPSGSTPTPTPTVTQTGTPTPTPTPTASGTPILPFSGSGYYASTSNSACSGTGISGNFTGNTTSFCTSTSFTGNTFASQSTGTYYLAYNGNYQQISITFTSNVAPVIGAGCSACPSPTPTPTATPAGPTYNYYDVTRFDCPSCTNPTYSLVARNNTTGGTLTTSHYYNNGDGYVYRIDGYNAGTSYTIDLDGSASAGTNCSGTCAI